MRQYDRASLSFPMSLLQLTNFMYRTSIPAMYTALTPFCH